MKSWKLHSVMVSSFFDFTDIVNVEKKYRSTPSKAALTPGNSYSGINADFTYVALTSTGVSQTSFLRTIAKIIYKSKKIFIRFYNLFLTVTHPR